MRSVSAKLIAGLLLCVAGAFLWLGLANLQLLRTNLEQTAILSAQRMADIIFRSTHHGMLHNNRQDIIQVIRSIGVQEGVHKIRIFDKAGMVQYSTQGSEVGHTVDQRADACIICHSTAAPLEKPESRSTVRIYGNGKERLIGLIRPIENEPSCSTAACHAHPADQRILGVLDVVLSLSSVDATLVEHERRMRAQVIAAAVLIGVIASLLIAWLVSRPVRQLIDGVHELAAGKLDFRFRLRRRDEIGELAEAFNNMASQVEDANRTLEDRIRKKTRELESAQERMIHSEKLVSLGQLAAAVAHELNNPLAGIYTYAKLLQKKLAPPKPAVDWIETIQHESRRCGEIVNNLLVFARRQNTDMAPNAVSTILDRTIAVVRHKLEMNSVELERTGDTGAVITCDINQIQQVLIAIIMNAVDALGANATDERHLTIHTSEVEGVYDIAVSNNGPPIPPDVLPHIFEPFFSTKQAASGVGLGLAVAYGIVKRHGGEILVETGALTSFHVRLPLGSADSEPTVVEKTHAQREVFHPHRG
jgi:two-component system, NtrC family, sensor kinase